MVSGSDDFTMFLWAPATSKAHIARMTGHLQTVNQVQWLASVRFSMPSVVLSGLWSQDGLWHVTLMQFWTLGYESRMATEKMRMLFRNLKGVFLSGRSMDTECEFWQEHQALGRL
jgi:hypothetical protein